MKSLIYGLSPIESILSFEQLNKKKAGPTSAAVPPKAAATPRNVPAKPPTQAPKTNLEDIKKSVQPDKKPEMTKGELKKEKPTEPKAMSAKKPLESKEKPSPVIPQVAHDKQGRKSKEIEED